MKRIYLFFLHKVWKYTGILVLAFSYIRKESHILSLRETFGQKKPAFYTTGLSEFYLALQYSLMTYQAIGVLDRKNRIAGL